MLPLGSEVAQLTQQYELARKSLYACLQKINELDKAGSEAEFTNFKAALQAITKETDRLNREMKLYASEFNNAEANEKKDGI
jgi:hypothetical protein